MHPIHTRLCSSIVLVAMVLSCNRQPFPTGDSDGKYTIAVIPMSSQHDFWHSIHAGALQAAEELGVEIIWNAPLQNEDRQQQIDIVESMRIRGVDGIVLAPVDSVALASPVEDAVRRGVPVVIVDSALDSEEQTSFVATDNYQGGALAAHELAKLLGESGKVVVLRANEGAASTMNRERGFLESLGEYGNIEVISSNQRAGTTPESAYQKAEQLLATYKADDGGLEADGIFTSCEPVTFGMMRAMEDADLIGKVRHVGFDASPVLVEGLRKGHLDTIIVQDPIKMGYLGVKFIVQHLNGKEVDKRHDTGVYAISRENVDDPANKNLVEPDLDRWLRGEGQ